MDKSNTGGSRQRQRVSVACLPCRQKRIRCDGAQPICSSCEVKDILCEYNFTENKRKPPSKTYVQALEARIKSLEEQLNSSHGAADSENSGPREDVGMSMSFGYNTDENESQTLVSALTGLMGRFNICDDGQLHYFGSQSNYHLTNTASDQGSIESTISLQKQGLAAVERLGKGAPLSTELQEHLLHLYWTWQNTGICIIHKKSFLWAFKSRTYGKYCTPLLLSAIFAISSRFSDRVELRTDPEDPSTAGTAFFEQARVLFSYEIQAATVATVQAAALMSVRALSDGQEALGWLYCGNAARMAFNLGLNIDCSDGVASGHISAEEAEVRKVTWWGCFILDKLFSIAVGRPSCTRKAYTTCSKPSLDYEVEFEPWNPKFGSSFHGPAVTMPSRAISTGHYAAECLSIASEAMDQIYAPNSGLSAQEREHVIFKADVESRSFYLGLPSHLRLPAIINSPIPPHIYQLHMQYHVNLILLHRPLLKISSIMAADPSTSFPLEGPHAKACRDSALEICKLLKLYKQHYTLRFSSIATVHIAMTAALIHLVDIKLQDPKSEQQAIRGFATCVDALEEMKQAWPAWSELALSAVRHVREEWLVACNSGV